jgi:CBS domain containing-hemolysin-like protein
MDAAPVLALAVIVISAGASFFFALAETALFSLSKWQVRQLAERNTHLGAVVTRLLAEPQDVLATMVLGNTFAGAAMLAVGLWLSLRQDWPLAVTVLLLLLLVLLGGEVLPKTLAVRRAESWALRVARPLDLLHRLARPLHQLAQRLNRALLRVIVPQSVKPQANFSDAEYQELVELAFQQGTLPQSARDIILQIIHLDRRTAKEVMRPRSRMAAISDDSSIEDMIAAAKKYRHRRLPMYDETPDTIVGILNTRALLLDPQVDLADAIELPSFVPETMNLLQLFKSLQRQQRGMAIVLDEFGGVAGLVTMEDILSELVGKLRGEMETEILVMEKLGEGRWRVGGTMRLDDFRREHPPLGDVPEVETVGGLLTHLLGVVPASGDSATFRGLRLTAQVVEERRVKELVVELVKRESE